MQARKKKDLYVWLAKTPLGPSVKFHVANGKGLSFASQISRPVAAGSMAIPLFLMGCFTAIVQLSAALVASSCCEFSSNMEFWGTIQVLCQGLGHSTGWPNTMTVSCACAVHTMAELKLSGNHLKGSRPVLSFDEVREWLSGSLKKYLLGYVHAAEACIT